MRGGASISRKSSVMIRLRVDDFLTTKADEASVHTLDAYRRFHDVVIGHVGRYLLGVIPLTAGAEAIGWASSQPSIVVGMHGTDHDEREQNQFRQWETEAQIERRLRDAMAKFPTRPTVYMPPHNVIDHRTARVVASLGFDAVTFGPGSDAMVVQHCTALGPCPLVSTWPKEYGRSDELMARDQSVEYMHENAVGRTIYLTLHWTWEHNIGLDSLGRYLSALTGLFEDFTVEGCSDIP